MNLCITHPSVIWEKSEMSQINYFKRKKSDGMPNAFVNQSGKARFGVYLPED